MKLKTRPFPRTIISVLLASVFVSFGAHAADDPQALRAEVDALKKELRELRGLITAGSTEAASKEKKSGS